MEEAPKAPKPEIEAEQRNAEEPLRDSEALFRTMFTATATGIATSTPQGRFLQANAAYCDMLGYTEEELQSCNFAALTHPDDIALNLKLRDEVLAGTRDSFVMEKRYLKKNGDIVWVTSQCFGFTGGQRWGYLVHRGRGEYYRTQACRRAIALEKPLFWKPRSIPPWDGMLVVDSWGMKILQNQRMIDLWNIPADIAEEAEHIRRFAWIKSQIKNTDQQLFARKGRLSLCASG